MRVLVVNTVAEFSIADVARGYMNALERAGHTLAYYSMSRRFEYHANAMPREIAQDVPFLSKTASENILIEAMYHKADMVLIISGLNVHPIALWLLGQVKFRVAIVFTESPYDDVEQKIWLDLTSADGEVDTTVFTNDEHSAETMGWHFLPPAYDPAFHFPAVAIEDEVCDVLMIGTGWPERQQLLEAVNWNGIDFKIRGVWPGLNDHPDSPIHRFYHPGVIDNARIAPLYASAKICLNFNRAHAEARTPGPRVYELAACGTFILSDSRTGMEGMFGDSVATFSGAVDLEAKVRYYLENPVHRKVCASRARKAVQGETFDKRVGTLMEIFTGMKIGV